MAYEPAVILKDIIGPILSYLDDNSVLVDVGANIGDYTNSVFQHRKCFCYLFEPVPQYYKQCCLRFVGNQMVYVENCALGSTNCKVKINVDSQNPGWNTFEVEKTLNYNMTQVEVDVVRFDDYAEKNNIDRIDVMKIDVEGNEYSVFKGMHKTLESLKTKPAIVLEVGWGVSHPRWNLEVEEFEYLFSIGYKKFDYNSIDKTMDILILPIVKTS